MTNVADNQGADRFADALLAARLVAIDPDRLGGIAVRARAGPVREAWTEFALDSMATDQPAVRLPPGITAESLTEHVDLAASLSSGRPVRVKGLIARSRGGVLLIPMAERLSPEMAALIALELERDGGVDAPGQVRTDGFCVVLFDESEGDEPPASQVLLDRMAFHVMLDGISIGTALKEILDAPEEAADARRLLARVQLPDAAIEAIAEAVCKLGIASFRAAIMAAHTARCHAALCGRESVTAEDLAAAGRLVLASRATKLPEAEAPADDENNEEQPSEGTPEGGEQEQAPVDAPLDNVIVEAVAVRLQRKLLENQKGKARQRLSGKTGPRSSAGDAQLSLLHGRPAGVRRGALTSGVKLSIYETLRAAAPWQRIRREQRPTAALSEGAGTLQRLEIRAQDFRIKRFTGHAVTTAIFVVDASGSAASQRLAESKGAVELFLNECYVRRDQVALISFRGTGAEILVPPTRALTRARRLLTALAGGGGTPLASGLQAALALAQNLRRQGQTPLLVVLTDGRANVGLDGKGGRPRAAAEATEAARMLAAFGFRSLLLDVSMRGTEEARAIANAMDARYLLIPGAEAARVASVVVKARKDLQAGA